MELRLFERFDDAERHAAAVCFQHDSFALSLREPEDLHERLDHVVHGIVVVVMEQDLVQRDMRDSVLF